MMPRGETWYGEAVWRRSSACTGGDCLEVAFVGAEVLLRTTTAPDGIVLRLDTGEWQAFVDGVKAGDFQPPS